MDRDDRDALRLVGVAEDEAVRGLVEIEIGDRQEDAVAVGMRAPHLDVERRYEELPARRVERAARNGERALDARAREKALFETE